VDLLPWIVFQATEAEDGGHTAECLMEPIYTLADSWEQLRDEVTACGFDNQAPAHIRLVRDEVLPTTG
jgi:hypothetical protein